jgi:hypothetical protein
MTPKQILKYKTNSLNKWKNILRLLTELSYPPLSYADCGYCIVRLNSHSKRPICVGCPLDPEELCHNGYGDAYKRIQTAIHIARDETVAAGNMVDIISADVKAEQKRTQHNTSRSKTTSKAKSNGKR